MARGSQSDPPVGALHGVELRTGRDPAERVAEPAACLCARGAYRPLGAGRPMEPERPCPMPRYTGFGTATAVNARYQQLVSRGTTALSVVFDLPTQMGYDSDAPLALGEVGRSGVAVDSLDDMRVLFGGIPLDGVSTSLTVKAPAALLLLMYQLVGEEQGVPADRLTGTIEYDLLTEYMARGSNIFPPEPSLRLVADTIRYCRTQLPRWNTVSFSGCRMAAAGATVAQEVAFTLADGIAYVRTAVAAGTDVDDIAPWLSFSFAARHPASEEVAGFRAARRIWARVMRGEFGARHPASLTPRLGTRRCGVPSAAQPAAANRTTADIEVAVVGLLARIEELGGAVSAVEHGFQKSEIERSARDVTRRAGARERVTVGADGAGPDGEEPCAFLLVDPAIEARQAERMAKLRAWRSHERVGAALTGMRRTAAGTGNVLYAMKDALAAGATVGEVCDALREVWGSYSPRDF
ncbi:methylmalonyl-CoA mutase family protein [Streptomyces sp. NPDC047070]|uniref:methylmalonyl-CoA mutase family protein n=1 Tax=Streptomyces sp. NPDC047070 TaxID=3154923 RepID=UPI00345245E8